MQYGDGLTIGGFGLLDMTMTHNAEENGNEKRTQRRKEKGLGQSIWARMHMYEWRERDWKKEQGHADEGGREWRRGGGHHHG